jgi:23S rRNA pseudouridine2605 synthase
VGGAERHVYFVLNKPVGVITTLNDPEGRRTVRELLPRGARVYPVGRLDADTSGLLLLTNDGDLAHRLMHPRYGVAKVYRVRLAREPRPEQLKRLSSGVRFDRNLVSGPARARRIDPGFDAIMIEVIVHEGRFRQVRKMCEAVGLEVTGLHRVGYGPIRLGPLARGMFRELSDEEVAKLRSESARAGGSEARGAGRPARERPAPRPGRRLARRQERRTNPARSRRRGSPAAGSWSRVTKTRTFARRARWSPSAARRVNVRPSGPPAPPSAGAMTTGGPKPAQPVAPSPAVERPSGWWAAPRKSSSCTSRSGAAIR